MADKIVIENKMTKADTPNHNGCIYPTVVLEDAIVRNLDKIKKRQLMGTFGVDFISAKTRLNDVSHVVTGLTLNNGRLTATIETLETPKGKLLQKFLDEKASLTLIPLWSGITYTNGTVKMGARLLSVNVDFFESTMVRFSKGNYFQTKG